MKIETWENLKAFANSLTDEQLNNPVRWWGDEKAGIIKSVDILQEDFVNVSGEGMEPISVYQAEEYKFDEDLAHEIATCPRLVAGIPILNVD